MNRAFLVVLSIISCAGPQKETTEQWSDPETIEIDESFRSTIESGDFAKLSAGYTYYEYDNRESDTLFVFVHGFSVPGYIWDSTYYAALDLGYGALRYDVYGRGFSDKPDVVYSADFFADQLNELLDALNIQRKINLLGLSYGGRTISLFASRWPERINQLIYVDPAGFHPVEEASVYPVEVTEEEVVAFKKGPDYGKMASGQLADFYDPEPFIGWDKQYEEVMKFKGFVRALISTRKNSPSIIAAHQSIARSGLPVHCIWGTYDQVVALDPVRDTLNARIPQLVLHEIDSAGHLPHMEQTAQFNAILFEEIVKGGE